MSESRIDATDRLRREGRWAEASKFRDDKRREFRAAGQKRAAASDAAWEAMIAEFPPPPPPVSPTPTDHSETIATILAVERDPDDESTELDDVFWVYDHLGCDGLAPADFPGLGAWALWTWARDNRAHFYESLWPKAEAADAVWSRLLLETDIADARVDPVEVREMWQERLADDFWEAMNEVTAHAMWVLDLAVDEAMQASQQDTDLLANLVYELSLKHVAGRIRRFARLASK